MNEQQAWQATVGQLQLEMTRAAYDTWVRNSELVGYKQGSFTIGVQNAYARDWLDSRLGSTITRLLTGMMGDPQVVEFIVWHGEEEDCTDEDVPVDELKTPSSAVECQEKTVFNPRYTFEHFVVGSSNRLAHAACMAVAENPANAYNPLFIYGGVGLGKTHLLHAIASACTSRILKAVYVSSEEFTNDLINAIRTHTTPAFRERYRTTDVLLVDDIQFIAGKESTQEEFFHTFNTLYGQNKQIVISSDRPPRAMVTLEDRLRSRYEGGLIVDLQPPDLETRIAILRSKAERARRQVPGEIMEQIARQVQFNIRELEGALTRVLAFSDLTGQPVTAQLVNTSLADLLPQHRDIDTEQVVTAVARSFGVSTEQMIGRKRNKEVVLPRQVAMYLLREAASISLPRIGQALGGRDHTTVMYACEKVSDLIERDDRLRRQVGNIREALFGRAGNVQTDLFH